MKIHSSFLPRISVTRPVMVTVTLVALLVVGLVSYVRLQSQAFPSGWENRWLWVGVDFPGLAPQEIDRQIRRPIEGHIRTVKGVRGFESFASSQWGLWMGVWLREDANMQLAYNQLVDRLERAKIDLPEEVRDHTFVWKWNPDTDMEVMWVGVALPDGVEDPYYFSDLHIKRPLERLEGVAQVQLWGVNRNEVLVEIDVEKMVTRGVQPFQLVMGLRSDNFALTGGYVQEGGKKFFVRSMAKYHSLSEIENILIPTQDSEVRLKDVARVAYDVPDRQWYQRIDGKPAINLGVFRESGENLVDVCNRVQAALDQIESRTDIEFDAFFNQGKVVGESIGNLRNTGLWGGFFAALVLLLFLRSMRMTALITLAIPLCLMITTTALYFVGWTLNLFTMMGLMVGVGMVVDNAIVIVENIYRRRAKGDAPHEASIGGASEVGLAITMATLTTVVVFLPLILMGGSRNLTFQLARIGMPVVVALVGSLFVALLFIPLAAKRFGGRDIKADLRVIRWMRDTYHRMLSWTVTHRRDTTLIVVGMMATMLYPLEKVKTANAGGFNLNEVYVRAYPPPFFTFEDISDLGAEYEAYFEARRELYGVRTIRLSYWKTGLRIQAFLHHQDAEEWWYTVYRDARAKIGFPLDQRMSKKDVIKDMKENFPKHVGVRRSVNTNNSQAVNTDANIKVFLYGEDQEGLIPLVEEAERRLQTIPEIVNIENDLERAEPEVQVVINRERAKKYGINAREVGQSIGFQLRGTFLPRYKSDDREVEVRLRLREADRQQVTQLKNYMFTSRDGQSIPLSAFASFKVTEGPGTIRRIDGKMRIRLKCFTMEDDLKTLFTDIDRVMDGMSLPYGYSWDRGTEGQRYREENDMMNFAIILAITFVFLLMGVLFESIVLPFSVLLAVPFSFLGVYWTLYLWDTAMNPMAQVGLIVLIGVVVNNAIVLVDMINRLRAEGMERDEAILEAGFNRFRPILMTTFTTVFGLMPMALGNSSMLGTPYAPLGRTMMGGLLCSTLLTLFVVPLFYTFLDDLRGILRQIAVVAFPRARSPEGMDAQAAD